MCIGLLWFIIVDPIVFKTGSVCPYISCQPCFKITSQPNTARANIPYFVLDNESPTFSTSEGNIYIYIYEENDLNHKTDLSIEYIYI